MSKSKTETNEPIYTCQICARSIKAGKGLIAHHGYQRPGDGWQTASCMGARHLPYEKSRDLIPAAIEQVKGYIDRQEEYLSTIKVNPPEQLAYKKYAGGGRYENVMIDRPENFNPSDRYIAHPGAYASLYHAKIYDVETEIRFARSDLQFLQKRYDNWIPPIEETVN